MIHVVVKEGTPPIPVWMDAVEPSAEELYGIAENYQIHPTLVHDCLDPAHLPKFEKHGDLSFMIIRLYDEKCDPKRDSVQAMTRKLAIFLGDRFLISAHRKELPFMEILRAKHSTKHPVYLQVVVLEMLTAAVETYHKPLEEMEEQIHKFEVAILKNNEVLSNWEKVFRTKCRITVIKRLLWHTLDTVQKFDPLAEENRPMHQDVRERIQSLLFFADSLLDDLNALLNIQLSLASHRANEESHRANNVMKVLTIFSAFFLPLNFIVGIYGMNFEHMPELKLRYGYLGVWGVLILVAASIYFWFVKKGWIRWGNLS